MGKLLDNFLKVYQLANFIKHSQLQQQLEQDRLNAQLEERNYQRTLHDFQLGQQLENVGATRVEPIINIQPGFGADWLQQGKKRQVTTPLGMTYQVPTFKERQQQLLDMYQNKQYAEANANIFQKRAEQEVTTTPVSIPGIGPFGTAKQIRVPNQSVASTLKAVADAQRGHTRSHLATDADGNATLVVEDLDKKPTDPDFYQSIQLGTIGKGTVKPSLNIHYETNDDGTTTKIVSDPKTGKELFRENSGAIGKTKAQATGGHLPEFIVKRWDAFEEHKKEIAAMPPEQQQKELPGLIGERDRLVASHPRLAAGPSIGGWPDIVEKSEATKAAPTANRSTDPRIGKIFVGPNGTRYRVKGIAPNGKAIVEPAP